MKTLNLLSIFISVLAIQARAGSLAVNGDMSTGSLIVGPQMTTSNKTSIGSIGDVAISALPGETNEFGVILGSSNAWPRIRFIGPGNDAGGFHFCSQNRGCFGCLWVASEDNWLHSNLAGFCAEGSIETWGDATIWGKLTAYGGMDPPLLLLDAETRARVAQRVSREIAPSKQSGAALFWNSSTKRLEVYVAADGAFYDLAGNLLANITPPSVAGAAVTTTYRVDGVTGQVVADDSLHAPRWRVKAGYQFDNKTGTFTQQASSNAPPVAATSSEALELR
jgi:hypothetical protein